MSHASLRVIRENHAALAVTLRSLPLRVDRGPYPADPAYQRLFAHVVLKAPAPIGLGDDALVRVPFLVRKAQHDA